MMKIQNDEQQHKKKSDRDCKDDYTKCDNLDCNAILWHYITSKQYMVHITKKLVLRYSFFSKLAHGVLC